MTWRFKAGFTLLELIVVLAILALGFAYVAPNFAKTLESVRFRSTVREVALELKRARGQALSQGKEVVFWVDVNRAQFGVDQDGSKRLPEIVELTLDTAETELLGPGRGGIRFFPDGSSTGGRIVLRFGGQARRIDVNWLTGRVSIADHAG